MANKYIIDQEIDTYVKKFHLTGKKITFRITSPQDDASEFEWAEAAISDIVEYVKQNSGANDQIGFTFRSENFKDKSAGWQQFKPCAQMGPEDVWGVVFSLFQSNAKDGINATDAFRLDVTRVAMPSGTGRRRTQFYNSFEEECRSRLGIVCIKNNDYLCLPRAIVVAKAHAKKDPDYKSIRQDVSKLQTLKAKKLMDRSKVGKITSDGAGIAELEKFQKHLKKYKITVYEYRTKGRNTIYEGNNPGAMYKINLLFSDKHYNVITSLTSAFVCSFYCENCHVPFNQKDRHRCVKSCVRCGGDSPCIKEKQIRCNDCCRDFSGQVCYDNHKANKMCDRVKRCLKCLKTMDMGKHKKEHVCGEIYCKICQEHQIRGHECYIKKDNRIPPLSGFLLLFFDLETRQERIHPTIPNAKIHEPNLCVLQQCCDACIDSEINDRSQCGKCAVRQRILEGSRVIQRFMDLVIDIKKKFKKVCCISHNGQAFDMQFILKFILEKTSFTPKIIMRGTKIILLEIDNIRFIDSINYLPMGLVKLPKAFDLSASVKKGFFPHLFNTKDNRFYVGAMPDREYYCVDGMFTEDRLKFLQWYDEQIKKDYVFNMRDELRGYCISDVDILRRACLKFRKYFLEECNVDPFLESVTIASACNLLFRRNFLKPYTIGLIPPGGYRKGDIQSKIALKWLISEEIERNVTIRHAARGREEVIGGFKVDGYCEETRCVFEFHGCYYHGCPRCFPCNRDEHLHDDPTNTMNMRCQRTSEKTEMIRARGYQVVEMWECRFREEKIKSNPNYLEEHPMLSFTAIDPRDAFYGGRTGCTKLHYKTGVNEEIHYADVCSLYPWVCKYGKFPTGHPKIYVGEECKDLTGPENDVVSVEGLIKCSILPPQNLYHPVLPVKQNDKLMFVLCRKCGEIQNPLECDHNEKERELTGTWVVDEVRKAVSMGYKIQQIFEIWAYETVQYDSTTKEGGLFTDFINKFLKIKQEASGFPSNCVTQEEKDRYIAEYFKTEGIKLEFDFIVNNPGLRSMAKLILNSFWGRFGMRENLPRSSVVRDPAELFSLLASPSTLVNVIQEINEEVLLVNWEYNDKAEEQSSSVNVVIAAYTTAQARLKLYEYLEALNQQVLYYDTDSVIYSCKKGERKVETGCFLGEMTDELEAYGSGSYITEFVSGGPKTYAYKVYTPTKDSFHYLCKVKGLTLNFKVSQLINFDSLKKMVLYDDEKKITVPSTNIMRTNERDVVTVSSTKSFQINVKKRRRINDFDTVPFGYKKIKN